MRCKSCGEPVPADSRRRSFCSETCYSREWRKRQPADYRARRAAATRAWYRERYPELAPPASLPGEIWRPVVGYDGLYEVSNMGRVKSLPRERPGRPTRRGERLLKPRVRRHGYLSVRLYDSPKSSQNLTIHRLVLSAFMGPCPHGHEGCHRDGDPQNNRAENLYWGTRSQNMLDVTRHGRNHHAQKTACKNGHPFTEANTRIATNGQRACRACQREHQRDYMSRKAAHAL